MQWKCQRSGNKCKNFCHAERCKGLHTLDIFAHNISIKKKDIAIICQFRVPSLYANQDKLLKTKVNSEKHNLPWANFR